MNMYMLSPFRPPSVMSSPSSPMSTTALHKTYWLPCYLLVLTNASRFEVLFFLKITGNYFPRVAWTRPGVFGHAGCQSSSFYYPQNETGNPQFDFENIYIHDHRENRPIQVSVRCVPIKAMTSFYG